MQILRGIDIRNRLLFLLVWTFAGPYFIPESMAPRARLLEMELPVFILLGLSSVFAGVCFFRLRKKMPFVGAGMLGPECHQDNPPVRKFCRLCGVSGPLSWPWPSWPAWRPSVLVRQWAGQSRTSMFWAACCRY